MTEKTIFEKIVDRELPARIIYEDDDNFALMDINPFEKGHVLIFPKKAYETIWDLSEDQYVNLQRVVHKIAHRMSEKLEVGISVYQRNLPSSGQEFPHVHIHLVPRFDGESVRPIFNDLMESRITYESDEEADKFLELLRL